MITVVVDQLELDPPAVDELDCPCDGVLVDIMDIDPPALVEVECPWNWLLEDIIIELEFGGGKPEVLAFEVVVTLGLDTNETASVVEDMLALETGGAPGLEVGGMLETIDGTAAVDDSIAGSPVAVEEDAVALVAAALVDAAACVDVGPALGLWSV